MVLMKFVVSLIFILGVCTAIYLFHTHFKTHLKAFKTINKSALVISGFVGLVLLSLLAFAMYKSATAPDTWCTTIQNTTSFPPAALVTAMDYFEKGNYDYDTGNCAQTIVDYAKSIDIDFKYPQAFNNRAYTYMRMRDYNDALTDLDKALAINPNYIQALMNRGDVYNYYLMDKQKAITDYEKIISVAGTGGTSVCGHLFLARHNGWNLGTILSMPFEVMNCRGSAK